MEIDQVFIMRFWKEPGFSDPEDPRRWRVQIRHVNTRRRFHVEQVDNAFTIIRSILNASNSAPVDRKPNGRARNSRGGAIKQALPSGWSAVARRWRSLFALSPTAASFERRGFHIGDDRSRRHLEHIGQIFISGFNRGLIEADPAAIQKSTDAVDGDERGFAVEGATMGAAIADAVMLGDTRLRAWLACVDAEFTYLAHVGAGAALARVPWRRRQIWSCLDPVHCWLAVDGMGFHDSYFRGTDILSGWRRVRAGYAARAYDQGVGRAIWFIAGGDIARAIDAIHRLEPARQPDLWSGLGLALGYAGGASPEALHRAVRAAGNATASLAQGAAFAAEARARARNVPAHTHEAVRILCGLDVEDAAHLVRAVRASLPSAETPEAPRYEIWRRGVQHALRERGAPNA